MTLYEQWDKLMNSQTDESFPEFWEKYSETEKRIYQGILSDKSSVVKGNFSDLAAKYDADPVIFTAFLDGIATSLNNELDYVNVTEDSDILLDIDWKKLFFNMLKAEADYLFTLEEWDDILTMDERKEIAQEYKKSKTVVNTEKKIGRNDPCPCGSGKKYKNCCGKRA